MIQVSLSSKAKKDLDIVPDFIVDKFQSWVRIIERDGLQNARKIPGLHDEPLKGDRKGQRSVRLNKSYRAIYIESHDGNLTLVEVIEVNKHKY